MLMKVSRAIRPLDKPKALMIIGKGIRSYEASFIFQETLPFIVCF